MSVLAGRPPGYTMGLILLCASAAVFTVGCASSSWTTWTIPDLEGPVSVSDGLWLACASVGADGESVSTCTVHGLGGFHPSFCLPVWTSDRSCRWRKETYPKSDVSFHCKEDFQRSGWFHAVRALVGDCLVGLVLAVLSAVANSRAKKGPRSRCVEFLACTSGTLGALGCLIYAIWTRVAAGSRGSHSQAAKPAGAAAAHALGCFLSSAAEEHGPATGWSLHLAAVGSLSGVVAGVVIAIFNKPPRKAVVGRSWT